MLRDLAQSLWILEIKINVNNCYIYINNKYLCLFSYVPMPIRKWRGFMKLLYCLFMAVVSFSIYGNSFLKIQNELKDSSLVEIKVCRSFMSDQCFLIDNSPVEEKKSRFIVILKELYKKIFSNDGKLTEYSLDLFFKHKENKKNHDSEDLAVIHEGKCTFKGNENAYFPTFFGVNSININLQSYDPELKRYHCSAIQRDDFGRVMGALISCRFSDNKVVYSLYHYDPFLKDENNLFIDGYWEANNNFKPSDVTYRYWDFCQTILENPGSYQGPAKSVSIPNYKTVLDPVEAKTGYEPGGLPFVEPYSTGQGAVKIPRTE